MFDPAYAHRNFPTVRADWLASRQEDVIDPHLPVIDSHHHLWDVASAHYFEPELLADLGDGHDVRATVHVECKSHYRTEGPDLLRPLGETEFVLACIDRAAALPDGRDVCQAIVGWADLTIGAAVRDVLQAHVEAGRGRFRGVRVRGAWHSDPFIHPEPHEPPQDLLSQPGFRAGFAELVGMDLACDLWLLHTQLAQGAELAKAFPEARIVLNHAGGPLGIGPYAGKRDEVFADWARDMRALAKLPNVSVKLGGLAMPRIGFGFDALERPPSSLDLAQAWKPYIHTCIEAFGADRCMFESNFPVDKGMTGYRVLWNAFKRMAEGASAADRHALFCGTAKAFYRIDI